MHTKYFIYPKELRITIRLNYLPTCPCSKNNYWLKKKYVLLRIKNTSLPNLTLYLKLDDHSLSMVMMTFLSQWDYSPQLRATHKVNHIFCPLEDLATISYYQTRHLHDSETHPPVWANQSTPWRFLWLTKFVIAGNQLSTNMWHLNVL